MPTYACVFRPPSPSGGDAAGSIDRGARAATAAIASIARDFSPRYECHGDDLVTIDVTGLERLLGPARAIADELRRDAASRGLRVHVAVASTCTAAIVLALTRPGVIVVAQGGEAAALAPVPIAALVRSPLSSFTSEEIVNSSAFLLETCTRWGIKTLGELAALPPADLAARFGKGVAAGWHAVARGEDRRPMVPTLEAERFDASCALEWPIEGLEPLSFVLTRLLEPLSTRLERRDRGAAVLHVLLRLVTKTTHARRLELPSPMRDVRALRTLALLDLESHPPDAAIDQVTVVIDPTPGRILQHTLFTRAHPTPEQLSTLLARLGALMGPDRFGAAAVVDSYRPGAFSIVPFDTGIGDSGLGNGSPRSSESEVRSPTAQSPIVTALRRCRHPVPARVAVADGRPIRVTTDRRGFAGGAVVACAGPWRASGEWWAGATEFGIGNLEFGIRTSECETAVTGPERVGARNAPVKVMRDGHRPSASGVGVPPPPKAPASLAEARGESRASETGTARGDAAPAITRSVNAPAPVKVMREGHRPSASGVGVGPHAFNKDEWDVALSDGAVYRIFQDRDTEAWFIDGIVD